MHCAFLSLSPSLSCKPDKNLPNSIFRKFCLSTPSLSSDITDQTMWDPPPTQQPATAPLFPAEEKNLRCPRCNSTNTKFCYYNNYNLSQPRHFCRSCRRYWTKGGSLRNIPVGGGSRRNAKTRSGGVVTAETPPPSGGWTALSLFGPGSTCQ